MDKRKLIVCAGTACTAPGGKCLEPELRRALREHKAEELVEVEEAVCYGLCPNCPLIIVQPDDVYYGDITADKLNRIVEEHILGGRPVEEYFARHPMDTSYIRMLGSASFFGKQVRITLRNCGIIDPESFDDYLQMRGYEALAKALESM
ncbi:MAG TPA: NAD(P)H-dependent oxidoreductase subunit E, partial [Armatimonadota bacterium]|nr:NAD(P)H-dependent oxidoreductase subunit E [Armatimonadota bacterium]